MKKNIIIYTLGAYILSILGSLSIKNGQDIGALVFIISPFIMMLTIRIFSTGWKSAGLKLNLRGNIGLYILSALIIPGLILILGFLGVLLGLLELNIQEGFFIKLLGGAIPIFIYCIFEEFGWRGFLEGELLKTRLSDNKRNLLVGIIWGVWHIPYYIVTDISNAPKVYHIVAMVIYCILSSFFFGEIRKRTNSVWPAVLTHAFGNITLTPILFQEVIIPKYPVLFDVQVYPIFSLIIWFGIALFIVRRRKS